MAPKRTPATNAATALACIVLFAAVASAISVPKLPAGVHGVGCKKHDASLETSLGSMANFSLNSLTPLAYRMNASGVLLAGGFTKLPITTSVLIFDPPHQRAFIDTYGTMQWFFPNGTYTYLPAAGGICLLQIQGGTWNDLVLQYSGLLFSTRIEAKANKKKHDDGKDAKSGGLSCAKPKFLDQYVGLITLTELPNSVVMTVDDDGIIHAMVATGPQDECQLLGGVYSIAYSLLDYAPINSASWALFPSLPAACLTNPIPYNPLILAPPFCSNSTISRK